MRQAYRRLAVGDRRAALDLLDFRQTFVYAGENTVLYAVFALLDWLEELDQATVELREEATSEDSFRVVLGVRGRCSESRGELAFEVSHLWAMRPGGRWHFQWTSSQAPLLDTQSA